MFTNLLKESVADSRQKSLCAQMAFTAFTAYNGAINWEYFPYAD